ncbi:MAG: hypothetical protein CL608_07800 [Anaerolineaceae bacterium]|nr:hypothetical protein [Anaerolineaceae bacterium]
MRVNLAKHQAQLLIVLTSFTLLAICYVVWIPPGEGVDEVAHFAYVRYVKEQQRLPAQPTQTGDPISVSMGHHPPLYYVLNALLIAGQDTSNFDQVFRPNPHFTWIENDGRNGWNVMIHAGQDELAGNGNEVIRAFFMVRLMGTLFGLITLFALFQAMYQAFPQVYWLPFLATIFIAFNPSFIFMSTTIHHDILQAMWFALGTWWMMHYLQQDATSSPLLAGVLVGCAILTKISGIVLGLGVAAVIIMQAIRKQSWSLFWHDGLISSGTAALIAGWWFVRNFILYGDFLGWNAYSYVFHFNLRSEPSIQAGIREFFDQASRNFWGGFGFMHITFPEIGRLLWLGTAVVLLGWIILWFRDRKFLLQHVPVFTASTILFVSLLGVYLRFSAINLGAGHGRYLFPAAFSIGMLLSIGVMGLVGQDLLKWAAPIAAAFFFGYALWLPIVHILPKYEPPTMLDTLPDTTQTVRKEISPGVSLIGYDISANQPLMPGMGLDITLYWQATAEESLSDPFVLFTLTKPDGDILSSSEGWPTPSLPPDSWPIDKIMVSQTSLYVPEVELPGEIFINAQATNMVGEATITVTKLQTVGGASQITPTELPDNVNVLFNNELRLRGYQTFAEEYQPNETVNVTLFWQVEKTPTADHTLFVHLLDASGQLIAQLDRPAGGITSPTSTWREGETWRDTYPVPLPANMPNGQYTLQIGMYDWPSLERLPIANTNEDSWELGEIVVGPNN